VVEPRRILVIKPSSLGDIVHALPAVHRLRQRYPVAHLAWVIQPAFAPVLEGNPDVDACLPFPREQFRGLAGLIRFGQWLSDFPERDWDLVVDFQGLLRSALMGLASRPGRWIGPCDAREGARLFYDATRPALGLHAVERNLTVAACAGADSDQPLAFPLPDGELPAGFGPGAFTLLHPFSRGKGKSLTPAQVEVLATMLAPRRVVLVGRSDLVLPGLPGNVENWINRTTLTELIALLRQAEAVVSVDSGPMHLAAALSSRLLSLHTWTDPRRVGPWQSGAKVWKGGRIGARDALDGASGRLPGQDDLELIACWVTEG